MKNRMIGVMLCVLHFSQSASADPGQIAAKNSDNHDIYLTVVDHNNSDKIVVSKVRVNSGSTLDIDLEIDGSGFAKVGWSTLSADDASVTGSRASEEVAANNMLYVDLIHH